MQDSVKLKEAIQRLQRQMPAALEGSGSGGDMPPAIGSAFPVPTPIPLPSPASVVNQIRNGELGHSVDTWFNPPPGSPTTDVGKEAAHFFSNLAPFAGQLLDFTDARTAAANNTLKEATHSTYDPTRSDWVRSSGVARLQGTATLDAPFPNNRTVSNNRKVENLGALIARRNSTIVIQSDNHIFCGLYDNTNLAPLPDWIAGTPFVIDAVVRDGVPPTTTERRYRVYAFTDRGYTYLSAEKTVVGAPADVEFGNGFDVYLTWKAIPGILQYWVYRFDVVAAKFRLLKKIGSGNPNYGDNNRMVNDDVGAYPSATNTTPIAYVATREHELDNLAVDGAPWDTLALAPPIPDDYDMALTTGEQVLRIGMAKALDRMMVDAVSAAGSPNIQSATGAFTALDTGRMATLLDADGAILHGPEAITFTDATHVAFATNVATANVAAVLYIVGGGDHGLLIDAIHVSYVSGAAFAAHPDDNRLDHGGQNPIAAPSSSSQGGSGGGTDVDPGEGGIGCIVLDCPVNVWVGNTLEAWPWRAVAIGEYLFSGGLRATRVLAKPLAPNPAEVHLLRVRASWLYDIELPCSPQQPVITERLDARGRAVEYLEPGRSYALISINGVVKRRRVREIVATGKEAIVGVFTLESDHTFSAGYARYRAWPCRALVWVLKKVGWREPVVGIILHNRKPPILGL